MRVAQLLAAGAGLSILMSVAAAAAEPEAPTSPAFDDKIICRKIKETGSLVRKKKMCFTQSEWDRMAEAEHKGVGRLVDELSGRPSGT